MAKRSPEQLEKENEALKAKLAEAETLTKAYQAKEQEEQSKVVEAKLPEEVAKEFNLVNWVGSGRQLFGKYGMIDLPNMTLQKAEQLVKNGFSRLVKKQ